jgi:pimeloyl-ACP methyl ester carboxylesterase
VIFVTRGLGLLILASLAWFALARWLPSPSERVYLLILPLLTVGALSFGTPGRTWLRQRLPDFLVLAGAALLVCAAYGTYAPGIIGPSWANLRRVLHSGEVFFAAYFVFSLIVVILAIRTLLLRACRSAFTPKDSTAKRRMVVDLIAYALLFAIAIPYGISAIFIHRFKVADGQSPSDWVRPFETVEFHTTDGVRLQGWFVPAKAASPRTVILCHGIGANSAAFLGYLPTLEKLEANVFFFDFRGHGASEGHTVSMGGHEKLDVLAAAQYVRERWPKESQQLFGLGISMGSSALILGAAEVQPPFDALVIDSGFASATDMAENVLAQFPTWLRPAMASVGFPMASLEAGYDLRDVRPEDCIGEARCRVLLVHARGDFLIPLAHAERLYTHAKDPKMLWIDEKVQHGGVLIDAPPECFDFVLGRDSKSAEAVPDKH